MICPKCNYQIDDYSEGDLKVTNSGEGFNGDYTSHWFEGIVTCPKCSYEYEVSDSD